MVRQPPDFERIASARNANADSPVGLPNRWVTVLGRDPGEDANQKTTMKIKVKFPASTLLMLLLGAVTAQCASIVWVSDHGTDAAFSTAPNPTYSDENFLTILRNAGHTVHRYNPPNSAVISTAHLAQLNTYDLVILGRAISSTPFEITQRAQWNVQITKPLLNINAYLARQNRLGWMAASAMVNGTPTPVRALNLSDLRTLHIFGDVPMNGDTTVYPYDEPLYQNTSQTTDAPVTGGVQLASATAGAWPIICEWPAGTVVKGGSDILGGYRMYFAAGNREPSSGGSVTVDCKENLTPTGELMFLRTVEVALNNGVAPFDPTWPVGFQTQPLSVHVMENVAVSFSAIVTGAPPRTVQWQRDDGTGVFTNIPGANFTLLNLPKVTPADNGARLQMTVANVISGATSDVVTLTVDADILAPTVTRVWSDYPFTRVVVTYSEPVSFGTAGDPFNYADPAGQISYTTSIVASTYVVLEANPPLTEGTTYELQIQGVQDLAATPNTLVTTNFLFTTPLRGCGFVRADYYSNILGSAVADLTNNAKFPYFYDQTSYLTALATPVNQAETFGTRLTAFFVPPSNGYYSFFLRSDDQSHLYMNTNELDSANPAGATLQAYLTGANTGYSTNAFQRSTNVWMNAGQSYYVEVRHKEGTSGDYVRVLMRGADEPFPADGEVAGIPGEFLCTYAEAATIAITVQPTSQTNLQNRTVTFSVEANIDQANQTLSYQWRRGGVPISGATGSTYTTGLLDYPGDDGAIIDVVISAAGGSVTSVPVTLGVIQDLIPPVITSVASVDGWAIDVCFDELVDTNAASGIPPAIDLFNYQINGGNVGISGINWGPDDSKVVIHLLAPVTSGFGVEIFAGIKDRAGNETTESLVANGQVLGWTRMDVGGPAEPGSTFACSLDRLRVVAGGTDIWGTADQMHYIWTEARGNFDIRVRVESLLYRDANSKAGVLARASTNADSANVGLFVTPPPTGTDRYAFQWRDTAAASSSSRHRDNSPDAPTNSPAYPNAWVRLLRTGAVFTSYISDNGTDWVLFGSRTNATLPERMVVGLATTSHNNNAGQTTLAVYRDLSLVRQPELLNATFAGGTMSFQFRADLGVDYTVWYKDSLDDLDWTELETRTGDGSVVTVTDSGGGPTRFYQVTIP